MSQELMNIIDMKMRGYVGQYESYNKHIKEYEKLLKKENEYLQQLYETVEEYKRELEGFKDIPYVKSSFKRGEGDICYQYERIRYFLLSNLNSEDFLKQEAKKRGN
jgi:hypothetical protein